MKVLDKRRARIISAICCMICMLFTLCSGTQYVYAKNSAGIVAVSSTVEKGGIAKVALTLSDNPGIWGLKFQVGYNHDALTLNKVDVGNVFKQSELTLPDSYDKETFIFYATGSQLSNITANGTLITFEFQVSDTAKASDYAISLELIQCINIDGDDVKVKMTNGKVTVVDCLHSEKEWKVTENPKCEQKGTETLSCKKCGQVFDTREIKATGHTNTTLKNVVTATETKEGYTGDSYCVDCNKLLAKGSVIPKIEKPKEPEKPQNSEKPQSSEKPQNSEKPAPQPSETEEEIETESETQIDLETESEIKSEIETESESESESEKDVNTGVDKKPSSPVGGIIITVVIIALVGFLAVMYLKFMRKRR